MKRLLTLLTLLISADALAQATDAPLLLDEQRVVALALADHPHVKAAEADQRAAEASTLEARRALVPDLQLSARYDRLSNIPPRYRSFDGITFPNLRNNLTLHAQVSVPLSELMLNLAANIRALGHSAQAARLETGVSRARIAYEARVAFLSYWRGTLALRTAQELVRAAEMQAADQQAREAAGTVARNDVLTFEVAVDSAVMAEQTAKIELATAEANLRAFLPSFSTRPIVLAEVVSSSLRSGNQIPPQRATPPSIAAMQEQADAARERAKATSLERLPKLSLYANGDYAAPNSRVLVQDSFEFVPTWEAGVRIDWSLSQLVGGSAAVQRDRANHRALVARVEEAQRKLQAERSSAAQEFSLAGERAQRAEQRVTRAAALAEARRGELEAGTALPLNVVLAHADLMRAKNERVDAVVERAIAMAKMDLLEGRTEASATLGGGAL